MFPFVPVSLVVGPVGLVLWEVTWGMSSILVLAGLILAVAGAGFEPRRRAAWVAVGVNAACLLLLFVIAWA